MKKQPSKKSAPKSRAKKHAKLLKQIALRHPGIKDVMKVYNQWGEAHKAEKAHQAAKHFGYKVIYSNSSDPKSFL